MTPTEQLLRWLCRDFSTFEHWKSVGDTFFISAVEQPMGNSDSKKARERFAEHLKHVFSTFSPGNISVRRWTCDMSDQEMVQVAPPEDIQDVDWLTAADYFLMHLAGDSDVLKPLNTERASAQASLDMRLQANIKRTEEHFKKTVEYMERHQLSLPQKKLDGTVADIRKRVSLVEEKENASRFYEITPYVLMEEVR